METTNALGKSTPRKTWTNSVVYRGLQKVYLENRLSASAYKRYPKLAEAAGYVKAF